MNPQKDKKLFLLDAMALIYRAHFAFSKNPRITSFGINTGAAFGFTNSLLEILQKEKPSHIGVAFDTPEPTFRHTAFEAYKANRQEQPEDITVAIPQVMQILEALKIPILRIPGYEADDLIGTIAKKAGGEGFEVYMMTMDKDYCQLVDEHIFLYRPAYMGNGHEVLDIAKVLEKFQVQEVKQVIDILGLQGDAVDNIPGIPGIGEKTAQKLIAEYGSVENLIANSHQLKGKQKENVENFAQQGLLSKQLATIDVNVPIAFEPEKLLLEKPDEELVNKICEELEFRTIKKRILGEGGTPVSASTQKEANKTSKSSTDNQLSLFGLEENVNDLANTESDKAPSKNIHNTPHQYYTISSKEELDRLVSILTQLKEFCFDTETDSLNPQEARLVGISICYLAQEAYYIPFNNAFIEKDIIIEKLKPIFENKAIGKIGQNIKYDRAILENYGVKLNGLLFDTMLAHYLIDADSRHGMDYLAFRYLNYQPISIENLIGKKGNSQLSMQDVPLELISEYAAEDADITYQLKLIFEPMIQKLGLNKLLFEVEQPLIEVLEHIERAGVKIDTNALKEYSSELAEDIIGLEKEIYQKAGVQFNISSPKQLGEVLFDHLKLDPKAKKTKTGQYATGEEVLSKLASDHPIIAHIQDYRELQKLKSTYVDSLPNLISHQDLRVHTSYNQAVAATGRLSSTNPNLQNIPIRTEKGREIRKAFVPQNEHFKILSADYSQIELRIMAAFSQEKNMMDAFNKGIDIHTATASKVFKVSYEAVNSDMRRKAKMVNFGIIYGISAFGLSQRLSIPRKEAAEIIEAYFQEFPAIKTYMDNTINQAREHGYVSTWIGRRRYLRDINSKNITLRGFAERNAINAPVQGTAADIIKIAMIDIHHWMKAENLQSKMILQVHDELVFEAHLSEIELLSQKIPILMSKAAQLEVALEVEVGVGNNWLEAH